MLDFRTETLSIGVTMTIGEYAIVDKLANFLIHHPEINIHLLISLDDFKMQHDFNIIWEKHSIYTDIYLSICEEFIS